MITITMPVWFAVPLLLLLAIGVLNSVLNVYIRYLTNKLTRLNNEQQ